ncbi:MAG: hypothetical protein ACKD6N_07835, partial [Candidatus Bathyarchaeota archaeon]
RHDEILEKHAQEIAKLREDMVAGFKRHDEMIAKLREDMLLGFKRHDEEIAKLREDMVAGFKRHDEELARLREDFNRMYKQFDTRLSRVERTLEKVTLDIEDEARIIAEYRLRELGYKVKVGPLILPEVELNIYGTSDELCILGEASIRASSKVIEELNLKIDRLRKLYPNMLKPKIIKVVYTSLAMPDLVEKAEKEGVWVLKATGDIVKLKTTTT